MSEYRTDHRYLSEENHDDEDHVSIRALQDAGQRLARTHHMACIGDLIRDRRRLRQVVDELRQVAAVLKALKD